MIFLMVLFLASVAEYFLEREFQPNAFGSVPAALWWAVATLTTTGMAMWCRSPRSAEWWQRS